MVLHLRVEDSQEDVLAEVAEGDDVEVPEEARRDLVPSAAWRAHGCQVVDVHRLSEWAALLGLVVPLTMIDELTQELIGWLRAILAWSRHVEIVDEDGALLTRRWPHYSSTSPLKIPK